MTLSKVDAAERAMERCLCEPGDWVGRITTPADDGTASTMICSLAAHRLSAEEWVRACSGQEPTFVPRRSA